MFSSVYKDHTATFWQCSVDKTQIWKEQKSRILLVVNLWYFLTKPHAVPLTSTTKANIVAVAFICFASKVHFSTLNFWWIWNSPVEIVLEKKCKTLWLLIIQHINKIKCKCKIIICGQAPFFHHWKSMAAPRTALWIFVKFGIQIEDSPKYHLAKFGQYINPSSATNRLWLELFIPRKERDYPNN